MISDNKEARGDAARFRIVSCSRKGQFPPQGRGAHSFLEKNPPHTPGRKAPGRFDFALDPQRHKGRGPRPTPLETNPQGDEGRETRIKQKTDRVVRSEAERTGVEIRRFSFAPRCATDFLVRRRSSGKNEHSAAGMKVAGLVGSAWRPAPVLGDLTRKCQIIPQRLFF